MAYSRVSYCYEDNAFRKKLFSPLKTKGFVPEKGSEIFVSNIPKWASLEDLCRFFEPIGDIFQIKLMTKSNCTYNRGFGYVTYMNKQLAGKALQILNNRPFMNGNYLSIQKSVDNCRIFVGGLPITKSKDEIWHELRTVYKITNLVDVITYRNYANPAHNRGFVFLEFRTHEDASYFRAKYWDKLRLFGNPLLVAWSIPTMDMENGDLSQVKILFIRNLDVTQTSEDFGKTIYELTDKNNVEKVYKFKDYAYVHLINREEAEKLLQKLMDYFRGSVVEVAFAKPPNKFTDREFRDKALITRRCITKPWSSNSSHRNMTSPSSSRGTPSVPRLPSSASAVPVDLEAQLSNITLQCMEAEKRLRDLQSHRQILRTRLSTPTSDYSSSSGQSSFSNVSYCHGNFSVAPDFTAFVQQYQVPPQLPMRVGYRGTEFYPAQADSVNTVDLENMVNNLVNDP